MEFAIDLKGIALMKRISDLAKDRHLDCRKFIGKRVGEFTMYSQRLGGLCRIFICIMTGRVGRQLRNICPEKLKFTSKRLCLHAGRNGVAEEGELDRN